MKIFILAFNLLIAFFASAQNDTAVVKWLTFKDSVYDLTMQYPSNWQLKPPTDRVRFFITSYKESDTDGFRENLNCLTPGSVEKGATLQTTKEDFVKSLAENMTDFTIVRSGYSKWNNVTAYEIEYTCTQTNGGKTYDLHMLQKVAIIKGKLYALTFTSEKKSYDKYIVTIRGMLKSFKVL